jgi:hypothetical protein
MVLPALAVACLAVSAGAAHADCQSDIDELQSVLAHGPADSPNVANAAKELGKAAEDKYDEVGCDNAVARAWRAYRAPPPDAAAPPDVDPPVHRAPPRPPPPLAPMGGVLRTQSVGLD